MASGPRLSGARRGRNRVLVQPSGADRPSDAGIGSAPGESEGGDAGELAQPADCAFGQLGNRGADDHERRLKQIRRLQKGGQRSIGPQVGDPPPMSPERESEADQAEVVLISGNAGEQRMGTATAAPVTAQGEEPSAQERAGEVLLCDRGLSSRPAIAELVEVGEDRVLQDALERIGAQ